MQNWLNTYRRYACDIGRINSEAENNSEDLVLTAEKIFHNDIQQIVERILKIPVKHHIIFLSGPSSSGKTTTGKKIEEAFLKKGCHTIMVSMDDFYLGKEFIRKLPDGKYDFESIDALDIPLMKKCVQLMATMGECDIPVYDFPNSRRSGKTRHLELRDDSVVIIEGIHALNPIFDDAINREYVSKVYVAVKQGVKSNEDYVLTNKDVRLVRRIMRDNLFRGASTKMLIEMWPDVVEGERKNIRPYRYNSDFTLNTIHIYEPCVMRNHALELLDTVDPDSEAGKVAKRLSASLQRFVSIDSSLVPENSLIREFIGGGLYDYS
ncbi:MAG: hypothetical protein IJU51_04795 [Clostridia bacterium]|nr:hypothetical protein [Clostridia bacterium]